MNIEKIKKDILPKKNVVGYSRGLRKKIKNGKEVDEEVIRVYVKKKVPKEELSNEDLVPERLDRTPTDVVEIGEIIAHSEDDGRRDVVRPLCPGISIGNYSITAGTLGNLAEKDGELFAVSNAHVFCQNPSKDKQNEKRIVQPGKYDGGSLDDIIGEYYWHDVIYPEDMPSNCKTSNLVIDTLNWISRKLGRKTRFKTSVDIENYQDVAVCKLKDGIGFDASKTFDFPLDEYELVARLFAGSNFATILCKIKYQVESGFVPIVPYSVNVVIGEEVRKSGRTTFDTTGKITDDSADMKVNYGDFTALIRDVIVTTNMSSGGDSGSDVYRKI